MDSFTIADNICRIQKEKGISNEILAELIGKSPRQVNRYRNGSDMPVSVLLQISDALNVSIELLTKKWPLG